MADGMKKGKKAKTPSRVEYEQQHPTVSFRTSRDLYDRLQKVKKAEGKSVADVLRIGVGLLEVQVEQEDRIREEAYEAGREQGFGEAYDGYAVEYPCSVCGRQLVVTTKEEKEFIKRKLREAGWGHSDCVDGGR